MTGADKAKDAYQEITSKYGTPKRLSKASTEEIISAIETLGLINRAQLLIDLSKDITDRFSGEVPNSYNELISLKGVGRYTANAVLCLSYGKKAPLVDESVKRIYTRCFNYCSDKQANLDDDLWRLAEKLVPKKQAKEFNLGLLDIGALFCKHNKALCELCPLNFIKASDTF